MKASSKRPRVKSSSGIAPPHPPSSGDPTVEEFVDLIDAATPPPSTLDDSSIHHMLYTIMTIQAFHGQLLVDVLTELPALRANLASIKQTPPPHPFDDES